MELPEKLKELYRHWPVHGVWEPSTTTPPHFKEVGLLPQITWFVLERMKMWEKKTRGEQAPYSNNAILATHRFCNIYRELDRQTIEFHTLLNPLRDDMALWLLNMFYCRVVARPETIKFTGLLSFDQEHNEQVRKNLLNAPYPRYGTPYVFPISVIQKSKYPTREDFVSRYLPSIIKSVATKIETWDRLSTYDGVQQVVNIFKFPFFFRWTEVLIDTAYQFPHRVSLFGRFPVGPGALPTVERIAPENDPTYVVGRLTGISLDTRLTYNGDLVRLSSENWEGICCEFRKFTNLSNGNGRVRKYVQKPNTMF